MEWIDTDSRLPEENDYYLVACKGGNVTISYYLRDRVRAKEYFGVKNSGNPYGQNIQTGSYSRKDQGKASCHFEIAHRYGYKIEYWMPLPKHPLPI